METIYVVEQGAYIRKKGDSLDIVKKNQVMESLPAKGLEKLVLTGYISLSGPVMDFLIKNRVETVFLTPTGRFRARLMIDEHKHVALRKAQYLKLEEPAFKLTLMKVIVAGKLHNTAIFLARRGRDYKEDRLGEAAAGLKALQSSLEKAETPDEVRGFEGAGARIYFSVFRFLIRNDRFFFNNRNRRPPKDPVNALLSFVYTLLTNEVISAIKTCGLDPYMGTLHEIVYGRPSLACDLVEEYRCLIGDRFVLNLLNRKMIRPEDFLFRDTKIEAYADEKEIATQRAVEMKPHLYRTFISSYEELMRGSSSFRRTIQTQVRAFADGLLDTGKPYRPITF
ncbi:CRISPR-associated endonuclease Cas1 [Desulfobacter latus]|uniref:CRISPR-associated endonuclease Cas1 n=1 Tax=Desulfobacter latus TaxID=2292 RepID=A0A850TCG1_9BACT|nr:CRISPR-associated endonuclease Cas1 [Desulfobacter latus]NWH06428.1 CRISPR-associated endonuclease Cas1 [Desulfobacter latus]